jgi:hypothetical protein
MGVVQGARDRELEHAVPEELEPLVAQRPVGRPRGVREDRVGPADRERVNQPRERPGIPLRAAFTGAR